LKFYSQLHNLIHLKFYCSDGDPHMKMFSGRGGHPQGSGPYVFAQGIAGQRPHPFQVQVCHKPLNAEVSRNWWMAVQFTGPDGVQVGWHLHTYLSLDSRSRFELFYHSLA
jgi:hypothetical protein